MVVELMSTLAWSMFGTFPPVIVPTQTSDSRPIVIFVDANVKGLIYHVDGTPVSLFEMLRTLERKWDRNKKPDQQRKIVIIVHEDVTLSRVDDLRRIAITAGPGPPRVFYFDKDKRLMFEITYSEAMAFSRNGPGMENR